MIRFSGGHRGLRQVARAFGLLGMFFAMLTAFLAAPAGGQCQVGDCNNDGQATIGVG